MATKTPTAPAEAQNLLLRIPACAETGRGEYQSVVGSVDEAVAAYERLRDESGEGASTFADGEIVGGAKRWRIHYNGRTEAIAEDVLQETDAERLAALERIGAYHETEQGRALREASDLIDTSISLLSVLRRSLGDENAQEIEVLNVALEALEKGAERLDIGAGIAARAYQPEAQS